MVKYLWKEYGSKKRVEDEKLTYYPISDNTVTNYLSEKNNMMT